MPRFFLTALNGPLKGARVGLPVRVNERTSLPAGFTDDTACVLELTAAGVELRNSDETQPVFVNGLSVTKRLLVDGDQISVGPSLLGFTRLDEECASTDIAHREQSEPINSTIELRREDALFLQSLQERRSAAPARSARPEMGDLLKVCAALNAIRGLAELERPLLALVLDMVVAERAAIIHVGSRPGEVISIFGWDRETGETQTMNVDREVLARVQTDGVAILTVENRDKDDPVKSGSRLFRSTATVPMVAFSKVLGILYVESTDAVRPFNQEDLHLLSVVAGVAAVAQDDAKRLAWLEEENQRLSAEINVDHNMVGDSAAMQEVYECIERSAASDATVLVLGESGTGKELVARALHRNGPRAHRPFVAINCAALPEELLESELFGHERGAFTGADALKRGRLEAADQGTVFLDEIGELSLAMQAKLLRVLQERQFERVGGLKPINVDIRIVVATNRDLRLAVKQGTFRQDLYFRLNVIALQMPPLRDRREDIPRLASYFAAKHGRKIKRGAIRIAPEASACLMAYDWPGNVRELENAIERAIVLGAGSIIFAEDLPESVIETGHARRSMTTNYHDAITTAKRELIAKALTEAKGNHTRAAEILCVHPNYLHRLLTNLQLRPPHKQRQTSAPPA